MALRAVAAIVGVIVAGCAPSAEVFVDLVSDYAPASEFDTIVIGITPVGSTISTSTRHAVDPDAVLLPAPLRLAAGTVTPGPMRIDVRLERDGRIVVGRGVTLNIAETTVVPIYLVRSCEDFECPGPGDLASATECDGAQCVDPECVDLEECGTPACTTTADCPVPPAACAAPQCVDGRCAMVASAGACSTGLYCDPRRGCIEEPLPDPFSFVDVVGAGPSAPYESNLVLLDGFDGTISVEVDGDPSATIVVEGADVGRTAMVRSGTLVSLRMTSSSALATATTATLHVGAIDASWTVTTFGAGCSTMSASTVISAAGSMMLAAPADCGRLSIRIWGGGGASGSSGCAASVLDGEGGSSTTLSRADGELLAAAGGGGGGVGVNGGASGGYAEVTITVDAGEMLLLEVGAGGRTNRVRGGGPGTGPYAGGVSMGGLGLGDLVVPGNPPGVVTANSWAPYSPASRTYAWGGRGDTNCTNAPTAGGNGRAELRWGP